MNTPLPEQGRPDQRGFAVRAFAWRGRYVAHAFRRSRKGRADVALCGVYADERDRYMSPFVFRSVCDRCAGQAGLGL